MDDCADAERDSATVVEVERHGEEAGICEPISLVAVVLGHTSGVMNDDHAWHGAGGVRSMDRDCRIHPGKAHSLSPHPGADQTRLHEPQI